MSVNVLLATMSPTNSSTAATEPYVLSRIAGLRIRKCITCCLAIPENVSENTALYVPAISVLAPGTVYVTVVEAIVAEPLSTISTFS